MSLWADSSQGHGRSAFKNLGVRRLRGLALRVFRLPGFELFDVLGLNI